MKLFKADRLAALFVCAGISCGAAHAQLTAVDLTLISSTRVNLTQYDYKYSVAARSGGPAYSGVTAIVASTSPNTIVVDGYLTFGDVPAGATVTSTKTMTLRQNRMVAFDPASLTYAFSTTSAPQAVAGAPQYAPVGAAVTLDGSKSTDPGGAALVYAWSFQSTPAGSAASFTGATTARPTFVPDVAGTYRAQLIVSSGSASSPPAYVLVSTTTAFPTADAGPNQTIAIPRTAQLDGSGSTDAPGNRLTYQWALLAKPAGSAAALSSTSAVKPTFLADVPGSYVAQLTVFDGAFPSAPAVVTITTANTGPVSNAGPDQKVSVSSTVQLDGSRSTDVNGDALTYRWSFVSRPAGSSAAFSNASAVQPTFAADAAGTYLAQLTVSDGAAASSSTVQITTTACCAAPVANPGVQQRAGAGATVNLNGSGSSDPSGQALSYQWALIARPAGSAASLAGATTATPTFVADVAGLYVAQLTVSNSARSSAPATVAISTVNSAPIANAGADQSGVLVGRTVNLSGAASADPDASPLSYRWAMLSKPAGSNASISGATSVAASFTGDVAGVYVAQLIVNDTTADSSPPDTVVITAPANQAPSANSQPVSTNEDTAKGITLGASDVDGNSLTYAVVSNPANGAVSPASGSMTCSGVPSVCTANVTYTPSSNYNGPDSFTFKVNDGTVDSATVAVSITVNAVNDAPTATGQSASTNEDTALLLTLQGGDIDSNALTYSVTSGPSHGALSATSGPMTCSGTPAVCAAVVTYTPSANYNGADSFTYKVNDGTADSAEVTVSITVNPVNDAPSFTKGADDTVLEDTGARSVSGWAASISRGGSDESAQTVNFIVSNNNNGLFSVQPAISASGTLTYTPAVNANGSATVSVALADNGGTANGGSDTSATQTFTITVTAVNDTPGFTKGADQNALKNAGAQSVSGWATNISAGPADESGQALNFVVSGNTNPALFAAGPAVSPAGLLTYTPATGAKGTATITLALHDDGGIANGGSDQSAGQTFVINVNEPPSITSLDNVRFEPGKTGQSHTVQTAGYPAGASMTIGQTGTLPAGVSFTDNHNGTATINGTPEAGTQGISGTPRRKAYELQISAVNGITPNASQTFTLNITCPAIAVSGASPLALIYNVAASSTYTQSGGNGTIAWSASGLPTNLSINSSTGAITGTPDVTGTFTATVIATDAGGCAGSLPVTVAVGPNLANQSYTGVGNTQLFVSGIAGAPTTPAVQSGAPLLNGATPAGGVLFTGANCTSGGSISTDAAGRFIFTPSVSATTANCTYTASSNTGAGSTGAASATANLSFTLTNKVWYVRHGATNGDGRSNTPFADFGAGANQLNCTTATAAGDYIYVSQGTGSTAGACALKANQKLIGAGATLTAAPLTITGDTAATPTLTGTLSANSALGLTVNGISMNTGTSPAVNFVNSDGTFTFRSISANGATNGIIWNNSSPSNGPFTITGDGSTSAGGNNSGGIIQNIFGHGISLTNARNVTIRNLRIQQTGGSGIDGVGVVNFTFQNGTITNSGDAVTESNIAFHANGSHLGSNLSGTVTVTDSVFTNAFDSGIYIANSSGTLDNVTISNNTFTSTNSAATSKGDAIKMVGIGDASTVSTLMRATINGNTISNFPGGGGIQVNYGNSNAAGPRATAGIPNDATNIVTITNNSIRGESATNRINTSAIIVALSGGNSGSRSRGNFNIANNGTIANPLAHTTGTVIGIGNNGNSDMTATIANNVMVANNAFGSQGIGGGNGTTLGSSDTPNLTLTVTGNTISNTDGNGILLVGRGTSGLARLKIANNTVGAPLSGVRQGIRVDAGNGTSLDDAVCLDMSGNTTAGSGGADGIGLRKQGTTATTNDFGIVGLASFSSPGVEQFVGNTNKNPGSASGTSGIAGVLLLSATSGFSSCPAF